jgi:crotonobetainyl-CoA:carnitine CoA-transferase CaiB-like acyl-CoA transferase
MEILDQKISTKTIDEWIPIFDQAGIPCGPVNTFDRVFKDPQVLHAGLVQEVEHPQYGKVKVVGPPATFSDSQIGIQSPPPMLGEHNREILTRILGYTDDEVEGLRQNGVV